MPGFLRTLVHIGCACALLSVPGRSIAGTLAATTHSTPSTTTPSSASAGSTSAVNATKPVPSDSLRRNLADTSHASHDPARAVRDTLRAPRDSSGRLSADSLRRAPGDTTHRNARDTVHAPPLVFRWDSPVFGIQACNEGVESAIECWRRLPYLSNQDIGFAGPRAWTLSLTNFNVMPLNSPYVGGWEHSPYLSGGLMPSEKFAVKRSGGDAQGIEEAWTPVVPLDTPVTRIDWEKGALAYNQFNLKLHRMLSDRVYLGVDYYSVSGDSLRYDYQFNVHQPYLGGWGFLGKIYKPIDRDSSSLVITGISHSIHAVEMRPRVGVWIDTNQVLEFFLDRINNSTRLTFPQAQSGDLNSSSSAASAGTTGTGTPGATISGGPGAIDSVQSLMHAGLKTLTSGVLYGLGGRLWTSQWEANYTSMTASEFRKGDTLTGAPGTDDLDADIYRLRGAVAGNKIFGNPGVTVAATSENWQGSPMLGAVGTPIATNGWDDREDAGVEFHPRWDWLGLNADAGLGRSSRMDNKIYWLERHGLEAILDLPFGFGAEAGLSSQMDEPEWEQLYRRNQARRFFPNPDLKPRTDRGYRGAVSFALPHVSLDAGVDVLRNEDVWLPRVLPSRGACADLADSSYRNLIGSNGTGGVACGDSAAGTGFRFIPDSAALALRNYREEDIDAWHLGIALGLGHWRLNVQDNFVLSSRVFDGDLVHSLTDKTIPDRVFKGRLNWKRSLLEDKLKVDISWDWEWYSTRYAWVPDLTGQSRLGKLDEYLVLDFQAAMQIKTFVLYFKAKNFNHDRYATEPGVHPPGLNFRFGVDWTLWD